MIVKALVAFEVSLKSFFELPLLEEPFFLGFTVLMFGIKLSLLVLSKNCTLLADFS